MEKTVTKNRNVTADLLKAAMIFCVMYGHSISMINGLRGVTWQDSIVNVFVTTFEMPLFIMVSGYFLWFSLQKKPHFQVLWKRVIGVVIPLILWEGLMIACELITNGAEGLFTKAGIVNLVMRFVYPSLWFLPCFLVCTILVILVQWAISKTKNKKIRIGVGAVAYGGVILVLHFVNRYFYHVPFLFPFFLVGFLLSKYSLLRRKWMRWVLIALAVSFVGLYPFYKPENSFYILGSSLRGNVWTLLPIFLHRFALGFAGCSAFYLLADWLSKKAANNRIVSRAAKLGTRTMELYILSTFVQNYLVKLVSLLIRDATWITDVTAPLVFGPLFLVTMTAVCLLIVYLIEKVPKLHKVLFGR